MWRGHSSPLVIAYLTYRQTSICQPRCNTLTLYVSETKKAEFGNGVVVDEVAQNERPHVDLHWLPSSL